LSVEENQISDISALSELTDLRVILLDSNSITDTSPLSGLTKIGEVEEDMWMWLDQREGIEISLGLRDNQIASIEPLVDNEGLSVPDGIDLRGNPLSTQSLDTYVPQLEDRGVNVLYDA